MVFSFSRIVAATVAAFVFMAVIVSGVVPAQGASRELATVKGTITISEARSGLRPPTCGELVVEARDALDNHLISETQPATDDAGACRYELTVPAQSPVWLRLQPVLVAGARVANGSNANAVGSGRAPTLSGGVALRFTIVAPATYFFAPNELKTVPLSY